LIEYRRLAVKDIDSVDVWRRGPAMQDGETVMVVSALKDGQVPRSHTRRVPQSCANEQMTIRGGKATLPRLPRH
jgi:hypothetical protein